MNHRLTRRTYPLHLWVIIIAAVIIAAVMTYDLLTTPLIDLFTVTDQPILAPTDTKDN